MSEGPLLIELAGEHGRGRLDEYAVLGQRAAATTRRDPPLAASMFVFIVDMFWDAKLILLT